MLLWSMLLKDRCEPAMLPHAPSSEGDDLKDLAGAFLSSCFGFGQWVLEHPISCDGLRFKFRCTVGLVADP